MLALEPVPELTAMLFALKLAKLSDEALTASIASLEARMKQTRSADGAGWAGIYREALALIPQAAAAQARLDQEQQQAQAQQAARQQLGAVASAVPQRLQQCATDWQTRLSEQTRELRVKTEHSIQKLDVRPEEDEARGETVYLVDKKHLDNFWAWLAGAERTWQENNQKLTALRANEALSDITSRLPQGLSFEIRPAEFALPAPPPPQPKGHRVRAQSRFEALGNTYKTVMGAVMGVSSVGFLAGRFVGGQVASVLPWAFGAVFVLAVIYAAVTVPKQHRQAMARQQTQAAELVRAELVALAKERLDQAASAHLTAIKKHLTQVESRRWSQLVHDATGGSNPLISPGPASLKGLSPADLGKLQGEWRNAMAARLSQLDTAAPPR